MAKVLRFLSLPFCPGKLKTYLAVDRFEDVPVETLRQDGAEGVLVDADGTLCPHHGRDFSASVIQHLHRMLESGLKVAIYTNAFEDRFDQFSGVEIVTGVEAKPDRLGFEAAMKNHLRLDDPSKVCMIGDNYITDGGAVSAGMRFIHVRPIKGRETVFHSATRYLAYLCARLYHSRTFRGRIRSSTAQVEARK